MATGVAVAIASALAVSLLPRLIEPAKTIEVAAVPAAPQKSPPTADVAAAPAPPSKPDPSSTLPDVAAAKIPGTPAKDGPVSRPVAVTEPAPSTVPATSPVTAEDPAAALRLRPIRWTACNSDDTDAALKACRALVADTALSGADLARAEWRLGYTIRKSGDLDGAITSLSDSVKTLATAEAHNDRGIAYLLKGDFDNALADYNEAIKLDDKNGEAWNNRAWTYYKTGQNQKARADADKAVSLIGDKAAYVWDTRGHINEALGDRKAAEADFVKAISLDPKLTASRDGLKRLTGH
jgi:Flp pilus assembly protein TadD